MGRLLVFITAIAILVGDAIVEHRTHHTLSSDDQCTQRYKMAVQRNRLDENKALLVLLLPDKRTNKIVIYMRIVS
jgi:hypothetical protein